MKLGIIFQAGSMGAWRYCCRLMEGLLQQDSALQISLFLGDEKTASAAREFAAKCGPRVDVVRFIAEPEYSRVRSIRLLHKKVEKLLGWQAAVRNEQLLDRCDVLFYPWPYGISPPVKSRPLVFIPHDLTYTRNFGSATAGSVSGYIWQRDLHLQWLKRAHCVVSAQYTKTEVHRVFGPEHVVKVIPLSRFSPLGRLPDDVADVRVKALGIKSRYVLCINNLSPHKNLSQLLAGYTLLKRQYPDVRLVLAGYESDRVIGRADMTTGIALESDRNAADVLGLGTVDDADLVALIQQAELLINPSLSEAGNGSGLDAWDIGTPVAMSDIPSFQEHLQFLGVDAELFDPTSSQEICDAMQRVLADPLRARERAVQSQLKFREYSWNMVADQYLTVFRSALATTARSDAFTA